MSRDVGKQRKLSELLDVLFVSQTCWAFPSEMWHPWTMNGEAPELWGLSEKDLHEPSKTSLECLREDQFSGSKMWLSVGLGCEGTKERGKYEDAENIPWYSGETGPVYESNLNDPSNCRLWGPQKSSCVYLSHTFLERLGSGVFLGTWGALA